MYIFYAYKTGHFFKTVFSFVFCGIFLFFCFVLLSKYTGVSFAVNPLTVGVSAVGGLPGILVLFILPMFF